MSYMLSKAVYDLTSADVTALGGAASDIATSLFGILATLLPVMVPLIVIYFAIRFVRSKIG